MTNRVILPSEKTKIVEVQPASALENYEESTISKYSSGKALATLGIGNKNISTKNGELAASSPFINVNLNKLNSKTPGQFPNSHTPATRQDLERAISQDPSFLKGLYADVGLALVTKSDSHKPNKPLAEYLTEQLKNREISLGQGVLIPLSVLELEESSDSAYGLIFKLSEKASKENILDLAQFTWDWTRKEGLARAFLYDGRDWSRNDRYLDDSNDDGRGVGVGEASSEDLRFGYTEEQLLTAFEEANASGVYPLVKEHLPDQ
jgi:hypothetical protein